MVAAGRKTEIEAARGVKKVAEEEEEKTGKGITVEVVVPCDGTGVMGREECGRFCAICVGVSTHQPPRQIWSEAHCMLEEQTEQMPLRQSLVQHWSLPVQDWQELARQRPVVHWLSLVQNRQEPLRQVLFSSQSVSEAQGRQIPF